MWMLVSLGLVRQTEGCLSTVGVLSERDFVCVQW